MSKPNVVSIEAAKRRAICDEFGELDRQVKAFSPTARRHEELRKAIQGFAAGVPAEESATFDGGIYRIHLSERTEERFFTVSAKKHIWKVLKAAKAWKAFSITLKAAEAELGAEALEELVTRERTGSRKVSVVAIAPAEAA